MSWVRLWTDMPTDPKWRVIARRADRPLSEVIAVFVFMMTNAGANAAERGELSNWSDEDVAAALDAETEHVAAIRAAMQGKTLEGNKLKGWEVRQPKREDNSAERAKAWREKHKQDGKTPSNTERNRTQPNAQKRSDADADADADAAAEPALQELQSLCEKAAGESYPRGFGTILALAKKGVSIQNRILPVIRDHAIFMRKQGKSVDSWAFYAPIIEDETVTVRPVELVAPSVKFIAKDAEIWSRVQAICPKKTILTNNGPGAYFPIEIANAALAGASFPAADVREQERAQA